jgi:hypothetical protein
MQTDNYTIARCPSCSVKLKFRPSRPPRACPRCKKAIDWSATEGIGGLPRAAAGSSGRPGAPPLQPKGFAGYMAAHWRVSRLHSIVPLLLGVLTAGALSVLKPTIALRGMIGVAAIILVIGAFCGVLYLVVRTVDYGIRNRRDPAAASPSWLARLAHLCLIMVIPVAPIVAAESVGPPQGWLATALVGAGILKGTALTGSSNAGTVPGAVTSPAPHSTSRDRDPFADPKNPFKVIED